MNILNYCLLTFFSNIHPWKCYMQFVFVASVTPVMLCERKIKILENQILKACLWSRVRGISFKWCLSNPLRCKCVRGFWKARCDPLAHHSPLHMHTGITSPTAELDSSINQDLETVWLNYVSAGSNALETYMHTPMHGAGEGLETHIPKY